MAPQSVATTSPAASTSTSTSIPVVTADGSGGLSQAQIGGILGGVVAFVVIVLGFWLCFTHSYGYRYYHYYNNTSRQQQQRRQRRRRRRRYYETDVSYEDSTEVSSVSESTVRAVPGYGGYDRRYRVRVSTTEVAAAEEAAAAQAAAAAAAGVPPARPGPNIITSDPYVLNPPPPRFPPTARPATYRQTAYPQFPGTRRFP